MADTTDTAPEAAPAAAPARRATLSRPVRPAPAASGAIRGARLASRERGESGISYPTLTYKGAKPAKGSTIRAELDGVTYEGRVHAATEEAGEVLVETDGLAVVPAT